MHSPLGPPVGEFAALAATPATSVVPGGEPAVVVPKRARAGARSVPPSLQAPVDSPVRQERHHGSSRSPGRDTELRRVVEELIKSQARDRSRIERLELQLDVSSKEQFTYTDRSLHELRGELSEFSGRVDELMTTSLNSVATLADLDGRFKSHLETAFGTIETEFAKLKSSIERGAAPTTAPPWCRDLPAGLARPRRVQL